MPTSGIFGRPAERARAGARALDPMAPAVDKLIGDYQAALKLARTAALSP